MKEAPSRQRIVAETPANFNCFVGFHDIIPWSQDERCIAIHRANSLYAAMEDCTKPIDICLWYPQTGEISALESTCAWNFQQGSRLQWLPGQKDTLAFNHIKDGCAISVLKNVTTGERRELPAPIYVLSPDGKTSISPNFTTLAHRWKAYGYMPLVTNPVILDQDSDGLWQLDIDTGKQSLFISTKRAAEFQAVPNTDPSSHFLCHVSFNPNGSRIVFLHRFFSSDGGLFTRMIATDRQARGFSLLAQEKVSHFDWLDDDTLLAWARFSGGGLAQLRSRGRLNSPLVKPFLRLVQTFTGRWKKKLLSEAYYKIPLADPKARTKFGWPSLHADGHPMSARSHRWVVTDSYPDKSARLPVILYDPSRDLRRDVHTFVHKPRFNDSDVKCDLHPRWSRSERMVAVDTCEAGYRQVRVLDVSDIVNER